MPDRIAILKPSALGDIVHALPVLGAVRTRYPDAEITWIVNTAYESLLRGHPQLTGTLAFDRGVFKKNPARAVSYSLRFADELRRRRFDLVLDLQGLLRTGLMCAATGAAVRVGFANSREGSRHFYTHRIEVPDADRIHAVDRYWKFAEWLGVGHLPKQFTFPEHGLEREHVRNQMQNFPRPWIAVAAGARWLTKRWPVEHFAELLNRAFAEFGGTVVFVGASEDGALHAELAGKLQGNVLDLTGRTSLPRLTALLRVVDVMVANDTGPLHLAAALGRPCIAPYTCTKTVLHGPYGQNGGVETAVNCRGSYLKNCPNGLICFAELTAGKLWGAAGRGVANMPEFPFELILASGSLGRRELMKLHGYSFRVQPANIDEPTEARLGDCRHYVGEVAWLKAAAVAPTVSRGVVLAADSVGWFDGKVIGKPEDEADARRIITMLSGTVHELWTGVVLWLRPTDFQIGWQERSLVRMKPQTPDEIEAYLATRQWVGCSGAYAIQMPVDPLLTVEEGTISNVIGLPMESLGLALEWARKMMG